MLERATLRRCCRALLAQAWCAGVYFFHFNRPSREDTIPEFLCRAVLWLFVINLGISFGAGLYEARITVPQWLRVVPGIGPTWDPVAAAEANVGLRFWAFVTTGPLTLLTVASLVCAWRAPAPVHTWWLLAAVAALIDRVLTFAYFIPTMLKLTRDEPRPAPAAAAKAVEWVRLSYVRHAATLVAWLAALQAFALMYRYGG
jgi:hypothetical protein